MVKKSDDVEGPLHTKLFDWRTQGPYRWKELFPLRPVLRPRQLGSGLAGGREGQLGGAHLGDAQLEGTAEEA